MKEKKYKILCCYSILLRFQNLNLLRFRYRKGPKLNQGSGSAKASYDFYNAGYGSYGFGSGTLTKPFKIGRKVRQVATIRTNSPHSTGTRGLQRDVVFILADHQRPRIPSSHLMPSGDFMSSQGTLKFCLALLSLFVKIGDFFKNEISMI